VNLEVQNILVRKSLVIEASASHVFDVFTSRIDAWWPRQHHIGPDEQFQATLESGVGGRWYERGQSGVECDWGRVLAWEPPHRLVLSWCINTEWKFDPTFETEVEVRFVREADERTRVELEHRKLERYGDHAEMMRGIFDSEAGWTGTLGNLRQAAEQAALAQ
jgi:uncharacterized protein YndB with AHSA1/START domain